MNERIRKSRWLILLILLVFVGGAYGAYRMIRTDPKLKKVRDLRAEMAAANRDEMTPDERQEKRRLLREAMEQLSDEQRNKVRDEAAKDRIKRQEAEMKRYASLSEQEKTQYLDDRIKRAEEARLRREQSAANGEGGSGRPSNSANRSTDSKSATDQNAAPSAPTPEDREARRKLWLDATTPDFRAMRDNYFADMRARRQQLGLPAGSGFGRP